LPELIETGSLALAPWAWPLALVVAVSAAVLRWPRVGAAVEATLARVGRPTSHVASWVWLGGVGARPSCCW
ncbi:MAG: hypothetical protein MUC96_32680, partial [Myxococcaceae bacterium]|nr:hypothetical protein [Myxococcaceae bacterium]